MEKRLLKTTVNFILTLLVIAYSYAQQNSTIAVGIAKGNCGDIGYVVNTGKNAYSNASSSAKNKFGGTKPPSVEQNGFDGSKGSYLVIVETNTKGINNCDTHHTFGVGYGNNRNEALQNAKKNLGMRNWNWSENKHGYDIKLQRSY